MYFSVFVKNVKQQLMYRSEFFLRIIGTLLYIYIQIYIWKALLSTGSGMAAQVSVQYMTVYVVLARIITLLTRTSFRRVFDDKVRKGDISIDFIRPVTLKFYCFAEQLSEHACVFLFTVIPALIISVVFFGAAQVHPASLLPAFQFGVSLVFAMVLSYYIDYVTALCIFWTKSEIYTRQILGGLMQIFSGASVPLWFYPDWLYRVSQVLPFRLLSYEPISIYLGRLSAAEAWNILALQLFWILAFYALERFIWSRLKKNVVVNGG